MKCNMLIRHDMRLFELHLIRFVGLSGGLSVCRSVGRSVCRSLNCSFVFRTFYVFDYRGRYSHSHTTLIHISTKAHRIWSSWFHKTFSFLHTAPAPAPALPKLLHQRAKQYRKISVLAAFHCSNSGISNTIYQNITILTIKNKNTQTNRPTSGHCDNLYVPMLLYTTWLNSEYAATSVTCWWAGSLRAKIAKKSLKDLNVTNKGSY